MKEAAYSGMVHPILEYGSSFWDPYIDKLQEESCGKVCDQKLWGSLKKRRKDNRLVHYTFSSVWVAEWPPFGK